MDRRQSPSVREGWLALIGAAHAITAVVDNAPNPWLQVRLPSLSLRVGPRPGTGRGCIVARGVFSAVERCRRVASLCSLSCRVRDLHANLQSVRMCPAARPRRSGVQAVARPESLIAALVKGADTVLHVQSEFGRGVVPPDTARPVRARVDRKTSRSRARTPPTRRKYRRRTSHSRPQ